MRRQWRRGVALLAVALSIAIGATANAAPVEFGYAELTGTPADEFSPAIDGDTVAWRRKDLVDPDASGIVVHSLKTGVDTPIELAGVQGAFDVAGDYVAFEQDWGGASIWAYRISTGDTYGLANSLENEEVGPRIDEGLLVWWDETTGNLRYRGLFSGVTEDVPGATDVTRYDVDNGRIVWVNGLAAEPRVYAYTPGVVGAAVQPVFNVPELSTIGTLRVHGDRLIMSLSASSDVLVLDIPSRLPVLSPHFDESASASYPDLFADGYVWREAGPSSSDVYFAQGPEVTAVAADPVTDEARPAIFGRRVVYEIDAGSDLTDLWTAAAPPAADRAAGDDRYETAVEVSKRYFSRADTAILCTGLNFPDALAATPLSRALGGPLLLTRPDTVDTATLAELDRLQVETVYIIGGTTAVGESVETQLDALGYDTERIEGADRYATSAAIAETLVPIYTHRMTPVYFARGDDFADALAVGAVAANSHTPILLVGNNAVPPAIVDYIVDHDLVWGVVVGGESAVTQDAVDALNALMIANGGGGPEVGDPIERWSGDDRYETATVVVNKALEKGWIDLDTLGIATGLNFPDALGGGAALGYAGCPLLLTRPDSVPLAVEAFLASHEYEIGRLDVFGGSDVVSDDVKNAIAAKLK